MSIEIPNIFQGQTYTTADGDEFTVVDLNLQNGQVVVNDQDGRQGVMDLDDLLQGIRGGKLFLVDDDEDDEDDESDGTTEELADSDDEDDSD